MDNMVIVGEVVKLAALIAGMILAGQVVAVGAVALLIRNVAKSPALVAAIESLANSVPVETRELIYDAAKLAEEATDGIPASSKGAAA